jgi:hypothetical protein
LSHTQEVPSSILGIVIDHGDLVFLAGCGCLGLVFWCESAIGFKQMVTSSLVPFRHEYLQHVPPSKNGYM